MMPFVLGERSQIFRYWAVRVDRPPLNASSLLQRGKHVIESIH